METQMETVSETETPCVPPTPPNQDRSDHPTRSHSTGIIGLAACIDSNEVQFNMTNMTNKYMTTKQVANELEVSVATVCRWVRDGILPAKRFGKRIIKIPCVEVEKLLDQNQRTAVN